MIKKAKSLFNGDWVFRIVLLTTAGFIVSLLVVIFILLLRHSLPSIKAFGVGFLFREGWDPINDKFGALPFIMGTLITAVGAVMITIPFSIATSLCIREYAASWLGNLISHTVDLLAAIPSVIIGMWGIFVLVPIVRGVEMFLYTRFSFIPLFNAPPFGVGLLSAIFILVIMTIPYSISIMRDSMAQVPSFLKEGAYALGATRWKMVRTVIIPYCKNGIIGGTTLALGRAMGETMAVTMVIGNSTRLPRTLFDLANTIASLLANQFNEASGTLYVSALIQLALILFVISLAINTMGRIIVHKTRVR
jgi:phosphate transport system permease protein